MDFMNLEKKKKKNGGLASSPQVTESAAQRHWTIHTKKTKTKRGYKSRLQNGDLKIVELVHSLTYLLTFFFVFLFIGNGNNSS
jgi:hypothetical protein